MFCLAAALLAALPGVGPQDAFRANRASVKAEVEFVHKIGVTNYANIERAREEGFAAFQFAEKPDRTIIGQWASDGDVEWYFCTAPEEVKKNRPVPKPDALVNYAPDFELLFDGETASWHILRKTVLEVSHTNEPPLLWFAKGPFFSWSGRNFPAVLKSMFPESSPFRDSTLWNGTPVEIEVYRKENPGGWMQVEIIYDPSVNYLPKFARRITHEAKNDRASVTENYLIANRSCGSGGCLPTEWAEIRFKIPHFSSRISDYDHKTIFSGLDCNASVGHFKVTRFTDTPPPVGFRHTGKIREISSPRGQVRLANASAMRLSLPVVTSMADRGPTVPKQFPPNVDHGELHEFDRPTGGGWLSYAMIILGALIAIISAVWFLRAKLLAIVAIIVMASGCSYRDEPIFRLSASANPSTLIFDSTEPSFTVSLAVRNEGNRPIHVFRVDGGCSCRKVDQSPFPALLEPGRVVETTVRLQGHKVFEPQSHGFSFESDHGILFAPVRVHAVPRYSFSNDSVMLNLTESDVGSFELTQREVYTPGSTQSPSRLDVPPGFSVAETRTKAGRLQGAQNYICKDTTYRVRLDDTALGLHKMIFTLRDESLRKLAEVPVVWQRLPFLSSSPERATLGTRPVRIFLRCPDDRVELTKVSASPAGIKAVVSSPREVTVMLEDDAPGVIDGVVEVETTDQGRPPLRFPVVRYAPLLQRSEQVSRD